MLSNKSNVLKYFILYKPYAVLCQFTAEDGKANLSHLYTFPKDIYPVGRLDADSEGLLLLTNDTFLNHKLLHPMFKHKRSYLVQVEGVIDHAALVHLTKGVTIKLNDKNYFTLPATAELIKEPVNLPLRMPPIRFRKSILTSWIKLTLIEGKNRQVRKMTASVGYPTLRLIRSSIEGIELESMQPGQVKELDQLDIYSKLNIARYAN